MRGDRHRYPLVPRIEANGCRVRFSRTGCAAWHKVALLSRGIALLGKWDFRCSTKGLYCSTDGICAAQQRRCTARQMGFVLLGNGIFI
ncbi:hypothetical protein U1Q18_008357, partial [Sarracenia purpurea var. burkii]